MWSHLTTPVPPQFLHASLVGEVKPNDWPFPFVPACKYEGGPLTRPVPWQTGHFLFPVPWQHGQGLTTVRNFPSRQRLSPTDIASRSSCLTFDVKIASRTKIFTPP